MKLALIFLVALVAFTHQQFQGSRNILWLPSPQPAIRNYPQPIYYEDIKEDIPFFRYLSPSISVIDSSENDELYSDPINIMGSSQYNPENGYQSRNKVIHPDARFYYNNNPFIKTATFVLTSTVTVATVQSCVPKNQLAADPAPACRKKRDISDDSAKSEDIQFSINPSETLPLTATASPLLSQMRKNRQLPFDEMIRYGLQSSQVDEATLGQVSRNLQSNRKRFFFYKNVNRFVVSTTVTNYIFINTIITKAVNLGTPGDPLIPGTVPCLPFGYIVCV